MTEIRRNSERPLPHGIHEVPGVEPVPVVMTQFGYDATQRILGIIDETGSMPAIVAPLNGSVVPIHATVSEWVHQGLDPQALIPHVHFINTRKNGQSAECHPLTSHKVHPRQRILVLEDIFDDGGTARAIEEQFPNDQIELWTPLQKPHSQEAAQKLQRTQVTAETTIPNLWVIAGGGMDGGPLKFNGGSVDRDAVLAVHARLADTYLYHDPDTNLPPYEHMLQAFTDRMGPWINPGDPLYNWMIVAEKAKMEGNVVDLTRKSEVLMNFIIAKVNAQVDFTV